MNMQYLIVSEKMYFSGSQIFYLMSNKSITTGFPKDLREAYRLLLRYPLIWTPIAFALISAGAWGNSIISNLQKNDSVILSQEEARNIRNDERERCDQIMKEYKEMVDKFTPKSVSDEKK